MPYESLPQTIQRASLSLRGHAQRTDSAYLSDFTGCKRTGPNSRLVD